LQASANTTTMKDVLIKKPKKKDEEYDKKQIEMGVPIELEHTPDRELAETIVKNHLDENPHYYTYFIPAEKEWEKEEALKISSRDAVKDTIKYWDKAKNKDFSKYWRKLKKKKKVTTAKKNVQYDWSCLMIDFPEKLAKKVIAWGKENIKDENLYTEEDSQGREDHIHTTVCYGIEPKVGFDEIKEKCDLKPLKVSLDKVSKFDNNEDYDVIKIDVKGEDLHKLHKQIEKEIGCPGNTYPEYKPHLTIAFVKKDSCNDLIGSDPFEGEEFELNGYDYSQAGEGNKHIKHEAHYIPDPKTKFPQYDSYVKTNNDYGRDWKERFKEHAKNIKDRAKKKRKKK